jgi:hypothetical protein
VKGGFSMVPNISKLLAVTAGSVESNVSSGKDAGFFIVVDCLVETLEQIIERWRNHAEGIPNSLFYVTREDKETQKSMLKERLEVVLEIASQRYEHCFSRSQARQYRI